MSMRREHDLLGDRDVPAEAYYGVHTLRAVENFPITATPISIYPDLISALACDQNRGGAKQPRPRPARCDAGRRHHRRRRGNQGRTAA